MSLKGQIICEYSGFNSVEAMNISAVQKQKQRANEVFL